MSEVGRKSTFPQHSFSWDVLSPRVAKKQLDRSAFLHHGTGVPAAITWFFGISKSGPRSPEVSLVFNGRTFDARIPVDNEGRYRLFWKNDFASALGQAFPNCLSAYQQKLNPNQDAWMQFEKVSAARCEVTFSTERSARVVWDDGVELDARFLIKPWKGMTTLVFQSRSGKPKKNADYGKGLELLLARFGSLGCQIEDAWVDSRTTKNLPKKEKRLAIPGVDYPIALAAMEASGLRLAMGRAQEKVKQKPGAVGGNSTKRIRLVLNVPPGLSPDQLEASLVGQTTSTKYFALLANPNRYRIEEAIHELAVDTWVTAGKNMRPGDRVIIWKTSGSHRVVRCGSVIRGRSTKAGWSRCSGGIGWDAAVGAD